MTFADIPARVSVFLDANTFVYHFVREPRRGPACTLLLERLERREIEGWISSHILAEVSHRLMTIEACSLFDWPYQGIAARLRRHPQQIQQLAGFRHALVQIERLALPVATVTDRHVMNAANVSQQYGLLTNDALVIALMQDRGLTNLASNDTDFDRVPGIARFAPV
jgi:predicted nucleic acid-binding protein